jgi:hypothetical protein
MTYELMQKLRQELVMACPVDTGQLKLSITPAQRRGETVWVIVIGNENGNMNGTPSNQYAAFTNNAPKLKNGARNPNYHWANRACEKWAKINAVNIAFQEVDVDEQI